MARALYMTARLPRSTLQPRSSFCLLIHTSLATVQSPESELPGKNAVTKILDHIRNFPGAAGP